MRSPITTHVLDTATGKPAANLEIVLELQTAANRWQELARGKTNADGRISDLLAPGYVLAPGVFRMTFDTQGYFKAQGKDGFYPYADVVFEIRDTSSHYHIPLLLSPYGYSTYRGN